MLTSLLELCGFEPEEVQRELPRAQKVFDRLDITTADIERAEQRIKKYFNIELRGVSKALGIHLRDLFDLVLAREERDVVIYGAIPMLVVDVLYGVALHSDKVLIAFPDLVFSTVMGGIFDKLDHVYEAAEKQWLGASGAHCSLVKARMGLFAQDLIPKPDLFISVGRSCDEAPKSDEFVQEFYGVPVQFINLCQDQWDQESDIVRGREFLVQQLQRCLQRVESLVGFEVTEDVLAEASALRAELQSSLRKCSDIMLNGDPVPLNMASWTLFRHLVAWPLDRSKLEGITMAAKLLCEELVERVARRVGVVPQGAPRVMLAAIPYANPSLTHLIEELGIAMPVQETSIYAPDGGSRYQGKKEGKTFFQSAAEKYLHKSNTASVPLRIQAIVAACKRHNLHGVLWNTHYACRPIFGDPMILKDAVEKALHIPMLVIEDDYWDSRYRTTPQITTRLEAFAEMVKSAKEGQA